MGKKSKRPSRGAAKLKKKNELPPGVPSHWNDYFKMDEDGWITVPPDATRPGAIDAMKWLTSYEEGGQQGVKKQCFCCGKKEEEPGTKLLKCTGCLCVYYCSKECQAKDWQHSHKRNCEMLREEKARLKSEEKEAMKERGISSKTKYRAELAEQKGYLSSKSGLKDALRTFGFWFDTWDSDGSIFGLENTAEQAVFVVHASSTDAFERSPFVDLQGLCMATLVPLDFLKDLDWIDPEWAREFAKEKAKVGRFIPACIEVIWLQDHQSIGVRGKMPHSALCFGHCPFAIPDHLDEKEGGEWVGKQWTGQVHLVNSCLKTIPEPMFMPRSLNKHRAERLATFDWNGLAQSEEFCDWAANKSWGFLCSLRHEGETGSMVTFFVNPLVIAEHTMSLTVPRS